MIALNAEQLLNAWEQGLGQPLLQRAVILLAAACPSVSMDALWALSIGQRDLHLLQLRQRLFGQQLFNTAMCPHCGELIEWENKVADLIVTSDDSLTNTNAFDIDIDDYKLRFRLPNSVDVAAVANSNSMEQAQQHLLSRCLVTLQYLDSSCTVEQLPEPVVQHLIQKIEALDPQADIHIALQCVECSQQWDVLFDIASFLLAEVNTWAEKMLHSIDTIAAAYGWSERDILNLSPARRQLYLGMLEA